MRLPSVLFAITVASFLVAGNALSAGAGLDTKVSVMTPLDLSVLDVSPNAGAGKRSLRGLKAAGGKDEERLGGAKLFNVDKLTKAMDDDNYAKKLFLRWKRHGFADTTRIKTALEKTTLKNDPKLNKVYLDYVAWLDNFFPLGELPSNPTLFSKVAIVNALSDETWAKAMFNTWRTYGYDEIGAVAQLNRLKLNPNNVKYLSKFYGTWLSVHHPSTETMKFAIAKTEDLFTVEGIFMLRLKPEYRDNLFRAWATKYSLERVREELAKLGVSDKSGVYKEYVTYLKTFFPNAGLS
ncbi:unnamed protein product [Phytophthora fragariaefolia]|uniref:RxLR effector protein n=1 Tax=Phytophthora fragariaefolia TaxID=1490495 RepID=A0A9W6Y959_9STRA|nr:unnamed protein product [Phytophthora fragariaefolia]